MGALEDRTLLKLSRQGILSAYGELVRRYQQPVFAICYRMLGERQEAEDAAQEVFVRAHRYLQSFDEERPFGPWIRRVAANYCLDRLQAKDPAPGPLFDETDGAALPAGSGPAAGPEQILISRDRREAVRLAVASLPAHYRAVIELRHFQEMSYREIADRLELPLNTVRSHLLRARKLLMERLNNE